MSSDSYVPMQLDLPAPPNCSQTVATTVATDDGFADWGNGADFRHFQRLREKTVATVATVATPKGVQLPWATGLQRLERMRRPDDIDPAAWEQLVFACVSLSEKWGTAAFDVGWSALDLYSCWRQPRARRLDQDGLAVCLAKWFGKIEVVEITPASAVLGTSQGDRLRHHRFEHSGACLIWDAYSGASGP